VGIHRRTRLALPVASPAGFLRTETSGHTAGDVRDLPLLRRSEKHAGDTDVPESIDDGSTPGDRRIPKPPFFRPFLRFQDSWVRTLFVEYDPVNMSGLQQ
jgi:hypothetical protein